MNFCCLAGIGDILARCIVLEARAVYEHVGLGPGATCTFHRSPNRMLTVCSVVGNLAEFQVCNNLLEVTTIMLLQTHCTLDESAFFYIFIS